MTIDADLADALILLFQISTPTKRSKLTKAQLAEWDSKVQQLIGKYPDVKYWV